VPATDGRDAASASSSEVHEFLDFGDGLGLDVEFGGGVEGSCPGRLGMVCGSAEGDIVVELAQLGGDCGVHFEDSGTSGREDISRGLGGVKCEPLPGVFRAYSMTDLKSWVRPIVPGRDKRKSHLFKDKLRWSEPRVVEGGSGPMTGIMIQIFTAFDLLLLHNSHY
jgi:hypothetical protein